MERTSEGPLSTKTGTFPFTEPAGDQETVKVEGSTEEDLPARSTERRGPRERSEEEPVTIKVKVQRQK